MLFAELLLGHKPVRNQRSLATESLAAGQQGVLLAGFFKLLIPSLSLPGIIAFHLYGADIGGMDEPIHLVAMCCQAI